ncbi:short-chain dehydrogenase [Apiospora aurea]|uniref:Short-chain dehydrogenase n=1 Tax=Apiospora aurea TaxID=335848 RepID=A0ABR1QL13_9PEZI
MAELEAIKFSLTKAFHKTPYPSISPLRPELSKAGQSVLVTGGGGGIGFHIAKAFLQAKAATVVIVGRREGFIQDAAAKLGREFPEAQVVGLRCDVAESDDVEGLWGDLKARGILVDVLVLNATIVPPMAPLLEVGTKAVMESYNVNVKGNLDMTQRFYKQEGSRMGVTKYLVHVSTVAAHNFITAAKILTYGLSKNAGALAMQLIAQDTKVEDMQIVTFNPGPVFTPGAASTGVTKDGFDWNDGKTRPVRPLRGLGRFPEAAFLHGRFVWNEWDVDEMKSGGLRKKIDEDPTYLRIGVHGI